MFSLVNKRERIKVKIPGLTFSLRVLCFTHAFLPEKYGSDYAQVFLEEFERTFENNLYPNHRNGYAILLSRNSKRVKVKEEKESEGK